MKSLPITHIALFTCFVLTSCQTLTVDKTEMLEQRINDGRHRQKVDNLLILVDDSSRLLECQNIRQRAFNLVERINRSLAGVPLNKGIRIFGPHADRNNFNSANVYGMAGSQTATLKESIITMTPDNAMLNPLAMALESTYHELKMIKGASAIVLLSDFEKLDSEVYSTVDMITQYYGDQVCLYGVYLGGDKKHAKFLHKILGTDTCGFYAKESTLTDPDRLVDFLDKVLFETVPVVEPTVNIVPVLLKEIVPEVVKPEIVEPKVSVPVAIERPVLTYAKLEVEKELRIVLKTEFDLDKSAIKPEYTGHLEEIANFMKKYSDTTIVIEGHTCDIATQKYNMQLSQERADAVKSYLVDTLSIDIKRIATKAYGETQPKTDNSTEEKRKQNRRAEAVITAIVIEEVESNNSSLQSVPESAQAGDDRFVKIDLDSVLDKETGLMWGAHDNGQDIGWLDAEMYCENYTAGGYSDWRMATQKELQSLYLSGQKNKDGFFITDLISLTDCCQWASDVSLNSSGIFSFKTGKQPWGFQADTYKLRALPVRSSNM